MRAVELERHVSPAPATHTLLDAISISSYSFPDSAELGKASIVSTRLHTACLQSGAKGRDTWTACSIPPKGAQLQHRNPGIKKSAQYLLERIVRVEIRCLISMLSHSS